MKTTRTATVADASLRRARTPVTTSCPEFSPEAAA